MTYQKEIEELELLNKQGESYSDGKNRYGWRNPVRKDTGPLLLSFVIATAPQRILEIGTGHGLSALYLASGLQPNVDGVFDTIDFDEAVAASTAQRMSRLNAPVNVHMGDALDVLDRLTDRYQMVFFDGQKDQYFPQISKMIALGLIGKGTVVLADNVMDRRTECLPFLNWFQDQQIPNHIIQTECGLSVARL